VHANEQLNMSQGCPNLYCFFSARSSHKANSQTASFIFLYSPQMPCQLIWRWSKDTRGLRACTVVGSIPREPPWVHSSVVRAADRRSAGPWFKSGCALSCLSQPGAVVSSTIKEWRCGAEKRTPRVVEPSRAELNAFLFHHLSDSVTVSCN
jgi:hypothetical protein